jgi:hypothetical protein
VSECDKKSCIHLHNMMPNHIIESGVGNLRAILYQRFVKWTRDNRAVGKQINASAMRGVEHFITNLENKNEYGNNK